jgi:hypothetical protein
MQICINDLDVSTFSQMRLQPHFCGIEAFVVLYEAQASSVKIFLWHVAFYMPHAKHLLQLLQLLLVFALYRL